MKDRIKQIRKNQKLTQQEFADMLGVSVNNVINYENGRRNPTTATVKLICEKTNIKEAWLVTGDGDMYEAVEDEIGSLVAELIDNKDNEMYKLILNIMKGYQELDPKSRKVIDDLIRKCVSNGR